MKLSATDEPEPSSMRWGLQHVRGLWLRVVSSFNIPPDLKHNIPPDLKHIAFDSPLWLIYNIDI